MRRHGILGAALPVLLAISNPQELTMVTKISFRFAACLIFAILVNLGIANAGPMYVFIVADSPTTAGAGIAPVNGMGVSSSKSGPGTFQLYAVDDTDSSFGIKSYQVKL